MKKLIQDPDSGFLHRFPSLETCVTLIKLVTPNDPKISATISHDQRPWHRRKARMSTLSTKTDDTEQPLRPFENRPRSRKSHEQMLSLPHGTSHQSKGHRVRSGAQKGKVLPNVKAIISQKALPEFFIY